MFLNGVASVTAGSTAEVEATWMLPLTVDAMAGAVASWEVLDKTGNVWNFGDADSLRFTAAPVGTDTHVIAVATIGIPLEAPADTRGSTYQIRWALKYGSEKQWAFDSFTLYPRVVDPQGPSNSVVLYGSPSDMVLTLPTEFPNVKAMVYHGNVPVIELDADHEPAPEGHRYSVTLDNEFPQGPGLTPYTVIWKYGEGRRQVMEQASLWLVNPSLVQAQSEIRQFLLKAYADSGLDPDMEFQPESLMLCLLQGAELFNAFGYPTGFTMVNATGPLRGLWLRCATLQACRSQYLHEGMKAFNFGGQVVTLDVDRTQYWDSLASALQQDLDTAMKPFKENLVRRGILAGDGNVNANALRYGAVGAIGIAITPASPIRGQSSTFLGPFSRGR